MDLSCLDSLGRIFYLDAHACWRREEGVNMTKEEIKQKVLSLITEGNFLPEAKGKEEIRGDQLLEAYGMDSFAFIQMIVCLEKAFHVEVPEELLVVKKWETVNLIVETLDGMLSHGGHMGVSV